MSQVRSNEVPIADTGAAARSMLYRLFAGFLSHPTISVLDSFVSDQFERDIEGLMKEAGYAAAPREPAGVTGSAQEIEIFYASAFEAGLPKVSLREANYTRDGEKTLFEDLFRFYDHFGLDTSSGALREWPDHIAVELEFMHYLTWLESDVENGKVALRRAQSDFLTRHLSHWVGALADRLEQKDAVHPYPHIARLLEDLVVADIAMLKGSLI